MISVRLHDLYLTVTEMLADGYEYVEISMLEKDEFQGEVLPATLHLSGYIGDGGLCDYEPIDEKKVDPFYKFK